LRWRYPLMPGQMAQVCLFWKEGLKALWWGQMSDWCKKGLVRSIVAAMAKPELC
jgi:hypothetical protein